MAIKYKLKKKEEAPVLVDVPMDDLGYAANDYIETLKEIKNREETLESTGAELIKLLREKGKTEIKVQGIVLKIKEIKVKIKIGIKKSDE